VAKGETWSKFVGPMLIYCNTADDHDAMWKDALKKAKTEADAWPYAWAADALYPLAKERATATGTLIVTDPQAPKLQVRNMLVGLAAPPSGGGGRGGVDWQREAKAYQFWTRADDQGRFTLKNVRAGSYTLYAIADGVLGEFSKADITIEAGKTKDLGKLTWTPVRYGKQLWEIGVPDRTAAEFRHGDQFWQWGLYLKYPEEFPNDVNFTIGKSDPKKDWNYCQPPRIDVNRVTPTTWTITFDLPDAPKGKATLRIALAGSSVARGIDVLVNDKETAGTGPLPNTGVMHRDGIRGYWCERPVSFDAALLKRGTNTIKLRVPATSWTNGVLYDYLRLELDETGKDK
jgi:rhamnogalacturonan endolyase